MTTPLKQLQQKLLLNEILMQAIEHCPHVVELDEERDRLLSKLIDSTDITLFKLQQK